MTETSTSTVGSSPGRRLAALNPVRGPLTVLDADAASVNRYLTDNQCDRTLVNVGSLGVGEIRLPDDLTDTDLALARDLAQQIAFGAIRAEARD